VPQRGIAMDAKSGARERFESARDGMIELSHRIHAHPELGFEEEKASTWLCESLADAGFSVEKGICDLPTAFRARAGSGPLNVGICAEYDPASATPAATTSSPPPPWARPSPRPRWPTRSASP
jgi:metal-dependent amidase/aminoacylase/carboxypeptidase family protein